MNAKLEKTIDSLQTLFVENQWTLGFAESCTGGRLASAITHKSGSSSYFLGSCVTYCNTLKINMLNVKPSTLETYGAVSEEIAREMAQGVLKNMQSTFALSVSGIAGPNGGTLSKPVGTVCVAIACSDGAIESLTLHLSGSREEIMETTVEILLNKFLDYSKSKIYNYEFF